MAKVRFELNREGVRELLKSSEMENILDDYASAVVNNAGEGFKKEFYSGTNRNSYTIVPGNADAHFKNIRENTLIKALGAVK